jgi:L-lactate dehydrogenase complex protein LldG
MGSSKEDILQAIRKNKPAQTAIAPLPAFSSPKGNLIQLFQESVKLAGGEVLVVEKLEELQNIIRKKFPDVNPQYCIGPAEIIDEKTQFSAVNDPHALEQLELAIFEGKMGVAENGAVWVSEAQLAHRAAPFITQHLVLLLKRDQIVWNMHQAYEKLGKDLPGFGVFIAGPSKTADIEQSLVLGAHGPISLTVFLLH